MNKNERRLERAARLTPASDRARYSEEWLSDVRSADSASASADRISRGAVLMAWHLRVRQAGQILLARLGIVPAVIAWGVLAVVAVLSILFGGINLLIGIAIIVAAVAVLARAGVQTHWSHFLLIASLIIGMAAAAFAWWAVGLSIDAADSLTPEPPVTHWIGTAIVVFLLSGAGVVISAVIAAVRAGRAKQ